MPIYHECQRCTACCRWPGEVALPVIEIERLATFFQISQVEFIQRYTRLRQDRQGLALLDKDNGECVFLQGNDCAVQSVKPQQCRDFPNLWSFPGWESMCHAIPRGVSEPEYQRLCEDRPQG